MSSFTNALETDVLTHFFTTSTAPTRPTTWYLSLHTADPGETGSASAEVSGNAYARVAVTFSVSGNNASNSAAVEFAAASPATWGTITHVGIMTAETSGTMIAYGALASSRTVAAGDVLRVQTGDLDVNMS